MKFQDVAFIYQPHFITHEFRVAANCQRGRYKNYIVVTCSPEYNGVYSYPVSKLKEYSYWYNNRRKCILVPIDDCKFEGKLEDLQKGSLLRTEVIAQQDAWFNKQVANNEHEYKKGKPNWMLK